MGLFPSSMIDEVTRALDPVAVLEKIDYRTEMIQDAGEGVKCFCPIHRETIFRTLVVDKKNNTYRCSNFNCEGAQGGDLIDLYARAREQGYEQALLELANAFGIEIDLSTVDKYVEHTLEVARNYLELGVLEEAEEHFDRILRFKADNLEALEGLTRVYEQTDRPEQFQAARLRLAHVYVSAGRLEPATDLLKLYTRDHPDDVETRIFFIETLHKAGETDWAAGEYVNMADELASRGEIDRALEVYRTASEVGAEGVDVSMHVIQLLTSAGRREEAVVEYLAQADRREQLGDHAGAFKALNSALDIDPAREDLIVRMAEIAAAAKLGGDALDALCDWVKRLIAGQSHGPAGRALEAIGQTHGERPRVIGLRADLENARGNEERALELRLQAIDLHHQRGEFQQALELLDRTLDTTRGDNVALLSRKAELLREAGHTEAALNTYLEIVELFRGADEFEHAAALYQTIIDLEPDRIEHREEQFELYLELGLEPLIVQKALALVEAYRSRGEQDRAIELIYRALDHVPSSPEMLIGHGELFEELGRKGEAAEQFCTVGAILLELGKIERARRMLERALQCVPEHVQAREGLADVLQRQEMTLQAMSIYNDLLEFFSREGDGESVIRIARKILSFQPDHLPTLLALAGGYRDTGETDKQLATQSRLVKLYLEGQSYTRATELCEEMLSGDEDYTPALEQLVEIAEATTHTTQSVKYLWRLAQVHARGGRREQEQGIIEQILDKDKHHTEAWFRYLELLMLWATPRALGDAISRLVDCFTAAGRMADAIAILEEATHTSNPKPELFAGLAKLYRETGDSEKLQRALRTQAELLGKLLRDTEALGAWDALAAIATDDLAILRTRIEIMLRNSMTTEAVAEYRRLARLLAERKRYEEAEVALVEVLNQAPDDSDARDELISILITTRELDRAAEQIEEAAGRLLEHGRHADAIAMYGRIFEFDVEREATYRKIIAIHQCTGDFDGAMQSYRALLDVLEGKEAWLEFEQTVQEALALDHDNADLRERLAGFYSFTGRKAEAEATLLSLAVNLIEKDRFDDADRMLDKLLELNPDSVPARAHRAEILARQGATEQALSEFMNLTGSLSRLPAQLAAAQGALADAPSPFKSGNYEGIPLAKEYRFESFVVGERNNFAYATAMAVSRAPAKNYNPLFLYADVGLGKTHLCHAISHYLIDHHPDLRVLYTTTEEFVTELIEAIQNNGMAAFRNRHKLTDVLLIDDVQFLSGKERAQEEFFHVFNAIFQGGKQIVLTSDRPPKDITHLEKRLKSRFGAGIIVDIQPPDLETRMAIVRHEMEARGKEDALSDEIVLYIAEHIESNVRDLKGALNQVIARQDVSGEKIDVVATRALLQQNYTEA